MLFESWKARQKAFEQEEWDEMYILSINRSPVIPTGHIAMNDLLLGARHSKRKSAVGQAAYSISALLRSKIGRRYLPILAAAHL